MYLMIKLNVSKRIGGASACSTFLPAMLILFAINLIGLSWQHAFNRQAGASKSTNATIDGYTTLHKTPNIILLGSSLIKNPFWLSDIHYLAKTLDYDSYHDCSKLQSELSDKDLKDSYVFDFGMPGAMVSDIYLLTEKLLLGRLKPHLVIYAIGPRDFNDRVITSEITTPTFDRLFSALDLAKANWPYRMDFGQKINFLLDRFIFAYRKRGQWQMALASIFKRTLDKLAPQTKAKQFWSTPDNSQFASTSNPDGYLPVAFGKQSDLCWNSSIKDYKARYASFNNEQFNKQLAFLKALVVTTKKRNIELILVSMPLTGQNIRMMPPPLFALYNKSLQSVSRDYQISLIDLQNDKQFDQTCFYDTVHLNSKGGDKLASLLTKLIADRLCPNGSRLTLSESSRTQ